MRLSTVLARSARALGNRGRTERHIQAIPSAGMRYVLRAEDLAVIEWTLSRMANENKVRT